MVFRVPNSRRPVSIALVALACVAPLAPLSVSAQETGATPVVDAVVVSEPADMVAPVFEVPASPVVAAVDASGASVLYTVPVATDAVDGVVPVSCDVLPGAWFPVGTTWVTCGAQDNAGNVASVQFSVTVNPLPPTPTPLPPTPEPVIVEEPTATTEPTAVPTEPPPPTATREAPATATPPPVTVEEEAVIEIEEPVVAEEATPVATPVAPALALPWPLPGDFVLNADGGPVGPLATIWGGLDFPLSQEFGHTDFSVSNPSMYSYGTEYGLDGLQHPGLDVGMPAGTWLYSPVEGTVKIAGGTPYFTFYGNGRLGVGELLIRTDAGDEVVLGHMGAISVQAGQRVTVGQFVGLSGGENGDHLHLEAREWQSTGGFLIVDPRDSFLIDFLTPDKLLPEDSLLKEA